MKFANGRFASFGVKLIPWLLTGSLALAGATATTFASTPAGSGGARPAAGAGGEPSFVIIDTGAPDGRMAMASRPDHQGQIEIEAADDFTVTSGVRIDHVTVTGLLSGTASLSSIKDIQLEIYRVFPKDSQDPPNGQVPTRVNSPSDVDFEEVTNSGTDLSFTATILNPSFHAANSVLNGINPIPNQHTGGEGPVTGAEVKLDITLNAPFVLPRDHYFFIPMVRLSSGEFFWLSAAGPVPPVFAGDLQAWIRNADLDPNWLRVGTDIVGGVTPPKFNASFSLSGSRVYFFPMAQR